MKTIQERKAAQWLLIKPIFENFAAEVRSKIDEPVFIDVLGLDIESEYFHPILKTCGYIFEYQSDLTRNYFYGNIENADELINAFNKLKKIKVITDNLIVKSETLKKQIEQLTTLLEVNQSKLERFEKMNQREIIDMFYAIESIFPVLYENIENHASL